ncbi:unnamed protein product, partial [Gongylonema pulchrum]|uniref:Secreted protein n=1 Tax=Gongylonema pulchrum TaxID=637853 RepID=A0A183F0S9_9BILA
MIKIIGIALVLWGGYGSGMWTPVSTDSSVFTVQPRRLEPDLGNSEMPPADETEQLLQGGASESDEEEGDCCPNCRTCMNKCSRGCFRACVSVCFGYRGEQNSEEDERVRL